MKVSRLLVLFTALTALSLPACHRAHGEGGEHAENHKIIATSPFVTEVTITQPFVCQIRSQKHIDLKALQEGYLEAVNVKEGQAVKEGEPLFTIFPPLFKARLEQEKAEVEYARIKYETTVNLFNQKVVAMPEVKLHQAELGKAEAKLRLAEAELAFTTVRAPFDGIMDRLAQQQGSLVGKGELLTTISDNSTMWVYFNVPETAYFEFKSRPGANKSVSQLELVDSRIDLKLADGTIFKHGASNIVTVEGKFNNETGNIQFRSDFANPDRILRHGQTGTVLIHRKIRNALIIPQRATFEVLDKVYVFVVDKDGVAHQRPISIEHEKDDIFILKGGLSPDERIVLEGVQQVHDGQKIADLHFTKPEEVLKNQKFHAE